MSVEGPSVDELEAVVGEHIFVGGFLEIREAAEAVHALYAPVLEQARAHGRKAVEFYQARAVEERTEAARYREALETISANCTGSAEYLGDVAAAALVEPKGQD